MVPTHRGIPQNQIKDRAWSGGLSMEVRSILADVLVHAKKAVKSALLRII